MERIIILKNTDTGEALTLPVTPKSYPMAAGRAVERLDMAETGQIALPGLKSLFAGALEFMLPAQEYPFLTPGASADPQYYIGRLTTWSLEANVCRYIVTGTEINIPVLLGPLEYGEDDGTNDVNCKLPLYEYRFLDEAKVDKATQVTQNANRPVETPPSQASSYTVVKGDSLWAIAKKIYGDSSLAYKLATANGIKNPNLIYPGQVLTLPDKATLTGYAATKPPAAPGNPARTATQTEQQAQQAQDPAPAADDKTPTTTVDGMTMTEYRDHIRAQIGLKPTGMTGAEWADYLRANGWM